MGNQQVRKGHFNAGIEIEICCDWLPTTKYFERTGDSTIRCDKRRHAVEFVLRQEYIEWQRFRGPILAEVGDILAACTRCTKASCGTHVHISHPDVTLRDYPFFAIFLNDMWVTKYQEQLGKVYGLRKGNRYCEWNEDTGIDGFRGLCDERYHQLNIMPSMDSKESLWHVEFRGMRGLPLLGKDDSVAVLSSFVDDLGGIFEKAASRYPEADVAFNAFAEAKGELFEVIPKRMRQTLLDKVLERKSGRIPVHRYYYYGTGPKPATRYTTYYFGKTEQKRMPTDAFTTPLLLASKIMSTDTNKDIWNMFQLQMRELVHTYGVADSLKAIYGAYPGIQTESNIAPLEYRYNNGFAGALNLTFLGFLMDEGVSPKQLLRFAEALAYLSGGKAQVREYIAQLKKRITRQKGRRLKNLGKWSGSGKRLEKLLTKATTTEARLDMIDAIMSVDAFKLLPIAQRAWRLTKTQMTELLQVKDYLDEDIIKQG